MTASTAPRRANARIYHQYSERVARPVNVAYFPRTVVTEVFKFMYLPLFARSLRNEALSPGAGLFFDQSVDEKEQESPRGCGADTGEIYSTTGYANAYL